jgi:lysophospholipase L1-like esterase
MKNIRILAFPLFRLAALLLGLGMLAGCVSPLPTQPTPAAEPNTAAEPVLRAKNEPWLKRHEGFVEIAKTQAHCDLLFLGDSITDYWRSKGKELWDREYAPHGAVNFGISGDRTQHLLWRLQNGEIGGLKPKVIVMMIGTNNIGFESDKKRVRNTAPQIAGGIKANIDYLRAQLPKAKILLLAVFPRGEPDSPARADVLEINRRIAKFDDGRHVFFLNIGPVFLAPDGTIPKDIMPEQLHPTPKGYQLWADAMRPTLERLLK